MHVLVRLCRQERWALAALGCALAAVVLLPLARPLDTALFAWLSEHGGAQAHALARNLDGGARTALLVLAVAIGWHTRGRGIARALMTLATGAFVGELLKTAIERPRPSAPVGELAGNSLPSGHIMNTTIAAALVALLATRTDWSRTTKALVLAVAALAVTAQATGRMIHGSHWPSDVAPSVLLGVAWVLGTVRWADMGRRARAAIVLGGLAAYAVFYALPSARLHLTAPDRPHELHSHVAPVVDAPL